MYAAFDRCPFGFLFTMIAAGNYGQMVGRKCFRSKLYADTALVSYAVVSATSYIMTMPI